MGGERRRSRHVYANFRQDRVQLASLVSWRQADDCLPAAAGHADAGWKGPSMRGRGTPTQVGERRANPHDPRRSYYITPLTGASRGRPLPDLGARNGENARVIGDRRSAKIRPGRDFSRPGLDLLLTWLVILASEPA